MKKCPECKNNINDETTCPKCGCPIKKDIDIKINTIVIGIISLICYLITFFMIIKKINISTIVNITIPIFIIANMLNNKKIIKNNNIIKIVDVFSLIYLLFYFCTNIPSLIISLKSLRIYSFSYLLFFVNSLMLELIYMILIILIINKIKTINIIKEKFKIIYIMQLIICQIYLLTSAFITIQYSNISSTIYLIIYTLFLVSLSTYLYQITREEV